MPTATEYELFVSYKLASDSNDANLFDPTAGTLKVAIVNVDPDHTDPLVKHWSDISSTQVATGTAYSGPFVAANISLAQIGATKDIRLDGDDMTVAEDTGGGFTDGISLVYFNDTGTPTTSLLMFKQTFPGPFGNTFAQLNLNVHANGYFDR